MKRANRSINGFDYRFSTKPCNEVLNTYRFAYREYAPDTGRWLSQDPIFERGGHNLYAYCGNDPVNGSNRASELRGSPGGFAPPEGSSNGRANRPMRAAY